VIKCYNLSCLSPAAVPQHIAHVEGEVAILSRLDHQNIVKYLGCDHRDSELRLLLEFVPGGSIASLLRRFGTFSESVIRLYTLQVLMGLQYLHCHHVLHRDIKGANILISDRGQAKLADFGLSSACVSGTAQGFVGTAPWMAPETIQHGTCVPGSDIWGVACTVLEMAEYAPWRELNATNDVQVIWGIMQNAAPQIPLRLSPACRDLLRRCFARDPCHRPTCGDLLRHPFFRQAPHARPGTPYYEFPTPTPAASDSGLYGPEMSYSAPTPALGHGMTSDSRARQTPGHGDVFVPSTPSRLGFPQSPPPRVVAASAADKSGWRSPQAATSAH
jgi:serine/threonine protein kinase